jgi:hypothetical protein
MRPMVVPPAVGMQRFPLTVTGCYGMLRTIPRHAQAAAADRAQFIG